LINKEPEVYTAVSSGLRLAYNGIYIVGTELTKTPNNFPACTIRQIGNSVNDKYSTLIEIENAVKEDYEITAFSNKVSYAEEQARNIIATASDLMKQLGYKRIFDEPIQNSEATICRRVARFTRMDVI
jgi:hypothetical protein